jgi:FKBP-type peptidyl-prolyl cis-trans isomerase FkpA
MSLLTLAALAAATAAPVVVPVTPPANPAIIKLPLQPIVPAVQRACTTKTASGLGYTALRSAAGAKPVTGDIALVGYIGYLSATGEVFDQSQAAPLPVDGVIPGFGEGLKLVPVGSVYRLCVPAALGYGAQATGSIPANSDLVFQVELFDKKTTAEVEAMQAEAAKGRAAPAP